MSKLLDEYRRKRSADRTPEPMGAGAARPGVFVVQKHSASRMHYDLRLEWDGVLKRWGVPRGPQPDPAEKRLAMQTEDHPVEYADFEGVIPDGEYGAGPMIVWDRGLWRTVGDPPEGVRAGKLLFELKGFKLKGVDVGSDQGRDGKGVVADQGDRRRARAPRRRRALRRLFHPFRSRGRGAARARQAGGGDARALRGAEGPAAPGGWGGRAADAGRAAQRPVRRPRLALRAEVRRVPFHRLPRRRASAHLLSPRSGPHG